MHEYVLRFQSLARKLRLNAQRDHSYSAPHLLGWLDRTLVAVTERATSWKASQKQTAAEIGHQRSAYELVNSFLVDDTGTEQPPERENTDVARGHDDFWIEFMSDWLNW